MRPELKIHEVDINELKLFPGNPRVHHDLDLLVKSIETFGWTNPILVQEKTNRVLAGHGRLLAARKAGLKVVPVIYLDLTDELASAYTITDNRLSEKSEWDFPMLKDLILEIDTGALDISITGFQPDELKKMFDYDVKDKIKDANYDRKLVKMIWVLMGIPLEKMIDVQETLTKIQETGGVIFEQTAR
jgi:ParB-like chromosome segregation protein Spo0J